METLTKEKFEGLCNGTADDRPILFEKEREIVLQFHQELHAIYSPDTVYSNKNNWEHNHTAKLWKMMAGVIDMDYRTLAEFALENKNPQKETMKKINTLIELINERNSEKQRLLTIRKYG